MSAYLAHVITSVAFPDGGAAAGGGAARAAAALTPVLTSDAVAFASEALDWAGGGAPAPSLRQLRVRTRAGPAGRATARAAGPAARPAAGGAPPPGRRLTRVTCGT